MKDARTSLITALKSAIDTIGISTIATPFTLSSTSPYNIATRIGGGAIASKDSYVKVSYEVISNNTNTPYLKLPNTDYGLSNMFSSYKIISKDVGVHTYFFLVDNSVNTVITFLISATSGEMIIDNVSVEEVGSGVSRVGNTISHLTTAGYKHIPTLGAASQILQYSASGTAVWYTPPWTTNVGTVTSVIAGNGMTQSGVRYGDELVVNGGFDTDTDWGK